METFLTIISYVIDAIVLLIALSTAGYGFNLILEIEEITIGKASSQFLAMVISILAFYRIDSIPLVETFVPVIVIDNEIGY